MVNSSKGIGEVHERLTNDFVFFARHCLKVKDKSGHLVPFELNTAQKYLHQKIEEQRRKTGKVRVLVPKARQGGISTYTSGRFYHHNNRRSNMSTFILSHQSATTAALFNMVDRFHANCPDPVKPKAVVSNKRQLKFENGSEYTVGTAGSGDVGRGFTTQYLHLSEAAFFENTDDIQTGILQSVSDEPGTEIIVESTGNGVGNWFYNACMAALEGKGDYIIVFIPWFFMDEYSRQVPENFIITPEEEQLKEVYNLSDGQIYWRRKKIEDLKSEWKFKQEYPSNVMECFQTSGDPLVSIESAMRARKAKVVPSPNAPLIMGVDPKGSGHDSADIVFRQGTVVKGFKHYPDAMDPMRFVGICANLIDTLEVDKMFIDNGYGYQIASRLWELGYKDIVVTVDFSEGAIDSDRFLNKRAEMAITARDSLEVDYASIPDDDLFYTDIMSIPREVETSNGKLKIVSKDEIRKTYRRSPGLSDGWWLTFAYPVRNKCMSGARRFKKVNTTDNDRHMGPLKTLNKMRSRKSNKGGIQLW